MDGRGPWGCCSNFGLGTRPHGRRRSRGTWLCSCKGTMRMLQESQADLRASGDEKLQLRPFPGLSIIKSRRAACLPSTSGHQCWGWGEASQREGPMPCPAGHKMPHLASSQALGGPPASLSKVCSPLAGPDCTKCSLSPAWLSPPQQF